MKKYNPELYSGEKIIIYGIGIMGKSIYRYLQQKISVENLFFCDKILLEDRLQRHISPMNLKMYKNDIFILASNRHAQEMYQNLLEMNVEHIYSAPNHSLEDMPNIVQKAYYDLMEDIVEHELVIPAMALSITECCTLKCKECSMLIPYYSDYKHENPEVVFKAFDRLLQIVDKIDMCSILGGEPFCNQPLLREVLYKYKNHSKINNLYVTTNGTIIPNEKTLQALLDTHTIVFLNDYRLPLSKVEACRKKFQEYGVTYNLSDESSAPWFSMGKLQNYRRSIVANQELYCNCNWKHGCYTLMHGEFHVCSRSSAGTYLGVIPKVRGEYIDFMDDNLSNDKLRFVLLDMLHRKTAITACGFCNIDSQSCIPVAEQIDESV